MKMSAATPIIDTGMRGFLKWFAQQQPEIYKVVAPQISAAAPQAFSDYHAGGWKFAGMSRDEIIDRENALQKLYNGNFGRLGQADYVLPDYIVTADPTSADMTVPSYTQFAATSIPDDTAISSYTSVGPVDVGPTPTLPSVSSPTTVDTATAANTGAISAGTAAAVGSVIGAAGALYLSSAQNAAQNSIIQAQLQRAQAGLAPSPTSLSAAGVPTVSTSISGGNMILIIAAAGAALLLIGGSKK
jgi:hypothetical protein